MSTVPSTPAASPTPGTTAAPRGNPGARLAGLGMILGAVLVGVSVFLEWFTITFEGLGSQSVKGVGNDEGTALTMALGALGLAFVVLVLGVILAALGRGRGLAIAGVVLSVILLIVTAYAAFAPEASIVAFEAREFGEGLGISESEAKSVLEQAFEQDQLTATSGIGTYVALGGSVVALLASILGIARGRRREAVPPPPPAYEQPPAAPSVP